MDWKVDKMVVRNYIAGLRNADELLDMISAAMDASETKTARGQNIYPEVRVL